MSLYIQPTSGPGVIGGLRPQRITCNVMNRTGGTRSAGQLGAFAHDTTRGDTADVTTNDLDGSLTSGWACLVQLAAADVIHGFVAKFEASTGDNTEGTVCVYGPVESISVEDTLANTNLKLPLVIDTAQNANGLTADPVGSSVYSVFAYSLAATSTGTANVACWFNGAGFRVYTA